MLFSTPRQAAPRVAAIVCAILGLFWLFSPTVSPFGTRSSLLHTFDSNSPSTTTTDGNSASSKGSSGSSTSSTKANTHSRVEKPYGREYHGHSSPADVNRVTNGTLGFDKVFVVGLPERSDKRDALTLMSSLTGFDLEWVDAVKGETIPNKAVPFGVQREKMMETNMGSWRSHINAIRRVVELNLESALIVEDDLDWDVRLKPQLEVTAAGVRSVLARLPETLFPTGRPSKVNPPTVPSSPYGDDWDILWLGHCGEPFPELLEENADLPASDPARIAMSRKYTILNDATVPPINRTTGLVPFDKYAEGTRWVHITAAPICTFAYAISQRAARKILFDLSIDRLVGPFDVALAGMCRRAVGSWSAIADAVSTDSKIPVSMADRGYDVKCLSVTPPLFFHHKAKGFISGDSDIQKVGGDEAADAPKPIREKGTTENIVWSTRLNLANMLMGGEMEDQFA